jgi:hypothetical protein
MKEGSEVRLELDRDEKERFANVPQTHKKIYLLGLESAEEKLRDRFSNRPDGEHV